MHFQLSDKGSMESLSDGLFFDFFIVYEFYHVRVRAAGIGPAEREGFLFLWSFLQEKLMLIVEEEDAEGPMRKGVLLAKVGISVGIPFANGADEFVLIVHENQIIQKHFVVLADSVQHSLHF